MISLKNFQKTYKHTINKGLSFESINKLRKWIDFDFDVFLPTIGKNLQRPLCWSELQKQSFIISILRDNYIQPLTVIDKKQNRSSAEEKYKFEVLDGKQRLNTAFQFIDNEFSIEVEGNSYFFNDLPIDCQRQIEFYNFTFNVHYDYSDKPITDQDKIDIFESINWLGEPQEIDHLNNLKNAVKL